MGYPFVGGPRETPPRRVTVILIIVLILAVSVAMAQAICAIPGVVGPCQPPPSSFSLSGDFTGPQIVDGHHIECFDGQIVHVGARVGH